MTIAPFPHTYSVRLAADEVRAESRPPIKFGPPPQFGGGDLAWSPEHLLVAAALACFKTTFDAFARRAGLTIHDWTGTATGTLSRAQGGPVFTKIDIDVHVLTALGDEDRTQATLVSAEAHCIISRALAAPVRVTSTVAALAAAREAS